MSETFEVLIRGEFHWTHYYDHRAFVDDELARVAVGTVYQAGFRGREQAPMASDR